MYILCLRGVMDDEHVFVASIHKFGFAHTLEEFPLG